MNTNPIYSMTNDAASVKVLRWSARTLSLFSIGIVLLFAIGEVLNLSRFTPRELVLFMFFPLGVCLGLALAWWREALGGGITVLSLAAFYLLNWHWSSRFPRGYAFIVLALPGFLFLLSALWANSTVRRGR
jgi:hypothetical protein